MDHCIHHHVKDGGGECPPLGDPSVALKWVAMVASRSVHHENVLPVVEENNICPWSDPISDEDLHEALSVEGVINFLEVEEDLIVDLLSHRCYILEQLGFKGGGHCPTICTKTTE